jgi:anti-sigma factor RsiW
MLPLIVRAADGSLRVEDRRALDAHLASCAGCREALAGQESVSRALAVVTFDDAPPGFAARVRARVQPAPGLLDLLNWRAWTFRLAPVAALLALFAWAQGSSESTWTLAAAEEAWVSGPIDSTELQPATVHSAVLFDESVDGYDLLSTALEVQPQ